MGHKGQRVGLMLLAVWVLGMTSATAFYLAKADSLESQLQESRSQQDEISHAVGELEARTQECKEQLGRMQTFWMIDAPKIKAKLETLENRNHGP